jgi:hypothetical protein
LPTPPFVHYSGMLNLELISPVQIAVCPASATPGSAIMFNPEVSLDLSGQVRSVVPQQTPADAHSRRDEVPQIPFSDDVGAAVELTGIDGRRTSRDRARDVGTLEVRTHQDRTRGIRRAGQEALRTPKIQIVSDQPIMPTLLACYGRRPYGGRGFKTAIVSLHEATHGTKPIGTDLPSDAGGNQSCQTLTDGVGAGVK